MNQACIYLSRPKERNVKIAQGLKDRNLAYLTAPALAINNLLTSCPLPAAGDIVVFVSRNAVLAYFYNQKGIWPQNAYACAVGDVTARELADFLPSNQIIAPSGKTGSDSEALLSLIDGLGLNPANAFVIRAQSGRNWLAKQLSLRGWQTSFYTVYKRERIIWSKPVCQGFVTTAAPILLLTSSEAFNAIDASLKRYNLVWPDRLFVVTLHKRIAERVQCVYENSAKILDITITSPDDDSLLQALIAAFNKLHR